LITRETDLKIRDSRSQGELSAIELSLTPTEAAELRDALEDLLESQSSTRHEHVSSADYLTELTVYVEYPSDNR
jgi:hypothetical protein